jgi:hypothetical protein
LGNATPTFNFKTIGAGNLSAPALFFQHRNKPGRLERMFHFEQAGPNGAETIRLLWLDQAAKSIARNYFCCARDIKQCPFQAGQKAIPAAPRLSPNDGAITGSRPWHKLCNGNRRAEDVG